MAHYSISINLAHRKCVVVGGGKIAERKVQTLLDFGALVCVISPALTNTLRELKTQGLVEHVDDIYDSASLDGAFLAIAATDDMDVNKSVSADAQSRNVLVNVVDVPDLCTFFVPAMVRRGDLVISVSTSGKSPTMASRIRQQLESDFGQEYGELVELLGELRNEVKARYSDISERRRAYLRVLDSDVLDLLAAGQNKEAIERARKCIL